MAQALNRLGYLGIGLAITGGLANSILYNVEGGHRAIIFDQLREGILPDVKGEGTHFFIPWIQRPIFFDVRSTPRNVAVVTPSKDLQTVSITLRMLYRPSIPHLATIFKTSGADYDERLLPSFANEELKTVVAKYDATELITQRDDVSAKIRERLNTRCNNSHIILDDISITHLTFGKEFTQAVEHKQVAQQEAERARFLVEQAEQEKLANIIRAEGDSKAAELISAALKESGSGLIELRKIEAAKEIAATMSKSRNVAYLPGNNNGMLMNLQL